MGFTNNIVKDAKIPDRNDRARSFNKSNTNEFIVHTIIDW